MLFLCGQPNILVIRTEKLKLPSQIYVLHHYAEEEKLRMYELFVKHLEWYISKKKSYLSIIVDHSNCISKTSFFAGFLF